MYVRLFNKNISLPGYQCTCVNDIIYNQGKARKNKCFVSHRHPCELRGYSSKWLKKKLQIEVEIIRKQGL